MSEEEVKYKVQLAVYDLSQGMASQLGPALLGMQVDGIWHTGVVVYNKEHFFGGGIVSVPHAEFQASYHMQPTQMLDLGETEIPEEIFDDWLREVSPRFTVATYDLLRHNCNNFSDEAVTFLLGTGIPRHIVELPEQIFSTPLGMMMRPMFEQMQTTMRPGIPGFESYGAEPPPFSTQQPQLPVFPPFMPTGSPAVVPLANNPWATPVVVPNSVPSPPVPSSAAPPAPAPAPKPQVSSKPSVLAAHPKPLLSSDPPQALERSLGVIASKLRAVAPPPLDPADDELLTSTTTALLKSEPVPASSLTLVHRILTEWPAKAHFPCLSLLRLLLLEPTVYTGAASSSSSDLKNVLKHLLLKLGSDSDGFSSKPFNIMGLCSLSNALSHPAGQALLLDEVDNASLLVDAGLTALEDDRAEVRQMGSALLANQALALEGREEHKGASDVAVQSLCGCLEGVGGEQDNMTLFRRLLCVGRLVRLMGPDGAELVKSLGFDEVLQSVAARRGGEVVDLTNEILGLVF